MISIMDTNIEKDCTALGGLFNTIINDMRNSTPIWEDFSTKASKLHSSLKVVLQSIGSFLESFQKVADLAIGTKGATKDIGSALTRLCIRHRSIETKLKSLTSTIMDAMCNPLQEKLEEWKKSVAQLDKDHSKECKKAKADIKKAVSDTIRLQKKAKKGNKDCQKRLDSAIMEENSKFQQLEIAEKNAIRSALIEERSRFCLFVNCIKPFIDTEIGLLTEVTHLQEIMDSLSVQTQDSTTLPPSSEQVILDLKGLDSDIWTIRNLADKQSPPSSPSSLGSRKSSVCSINSINSSSSSSATNHTHSPTHRHRPASHLSQPTTTMAVTRLTSVSSQDSGFTSQDMLFHRPGSPSRALSLTLPQASDNASIGQESSDSSNSTPSSEQASTPSARSTWTNWPDPPKANISDHNRPHTISAAYEKTHARQPLSPQIFDPITTQTLVDEPVYARPATIAKVKSVMPHAGPKPKSKPVPLPVVPPDIPAYVNMNDLAIMALEKQHDGQTTPVNSTSPTSVIAREKEDENVEALKLAEAIRELDASTAALNNVCDDDAKINLGPSVLADRSNIIEDAELIASLRRCQYSTLPRRFSSYHHYSHNNDVSYARPMSLAGASVTRQKPPPPVRRSSSITAEPIMEVVSCRRLATRHASISQPPLVAAKPVRAGVKQPSHSYHKRSRSSEGDGAKDARPPNYEGPKSAGHHFNEQRSPDVRREKHDNDRTRASYTEYNSAHEVVERRTVKPPLVERGSCPPPSSHFTETAALVQQTHYASVQRQSVAPRLSGGGGGGGGDNIMLSHANVVHSLSSKFASIDRHDPSGARSVLRAVSSPGATNQSHYASLEILQQTHFAAHQDPVDDFPAPPSAAELADLGLNPGPCNTDYDV